VVHLWLIGEIVALVHMACVLLRGLAVLHCVVLCCEYGAGWYGMQVQERNAGEVPHCYTETGSSVWSNSTTGVRKEDAAIQRSG
jgi:hypothetical protein